MSETASEHLARAKAIADQDASGGPITSGSPDERTIPFLLAGILDALIAIAEATTHPAEEAGA